MVKIIDKIKEGIGVQKARVNLLIILTATVLMQLLSALQFYYARNEIRRDLSINAENELMFKASNIRAFLNIVETAVNNRLWDAYLALNNPDVFFDLSRRFVEEKPSITGFGVAFVEDYFPTKGRLFEPYSTRRKNGQIETIQVASATHDYTTSPIYIDAIKADSAFWCDPYMDPDGAQMILTTYIYPLHDNQGRLAGVMQVDLSVDWIGQTLNASRRYPSSFGLLLTNKGQLISGPNEDITKKKDVEEVVRLINDSTINRTQNESESIKIIDFKDKGDRDGYIFYSYVSHPSRWQIAVVNYDDEIYANLKDMRNKTFWLMLAGLLLLGFILHRAAENLTRLQQTNIEKERISSELRVASKIQSDMLPKAFPPYPERKDIDVYGWLEAAKEVDGDLYDYFIRDEKLFFCIGDVSGKGVPASLIMAVVHSLFRTIAAHQSNPANIIQNINEYCCQRNESGMFVTFFVGVLDLPTGRLRYCNAGHDLPLIVRKDGVRQLQAKANMALAVMDYLYTTQEDHLKYGDTLFLYTDGLTEAMNLKHKQFSLKRIITTLEESKKRENPTPKVYIEDMLAQVIGFMEDAPQSDDLTMLAIHYTPQNEEVLLSRQLTLKNNVQLVKELNTFMKSVNQELGMEKSLSLKLILAVEEAVVNVMDYAYPNGIEGEVNIEVIATSDRLKYIVTDQGIAFAPTDVMKADTKLSVEERPIGGLGIFLVRSLMDSINYERVNGKNVLTMWKKMNNLKIKENEN